MSGMLLLAVDYVSLSRLALFLRFPIGRLSSAWCLSCTFHTHTLVPTGLTE
ncbi:hypothetical protein E2C01_064806 [Portunus trituberculatus]|uniref:Uncharacterized protein n=1 Tax=Portunus trituberculatus TaxID=210409 RepID=A0A5B7HPU0_PORTR|nr:hypothetical protein [Portunus trituberculatus]